MLFERLNGSVFPYVRYIHHVVPQKSNRILPFFKSHFK